MRTYKYVLTGFLVLFLTMVSNRSEAKLPLEIALGTAPGDIAAYILNINPPGFTEVFADKHSEEGKLLGRDWQIAERGMPLMIHDKLLTHAGRVFIGFTDDNESGPSEFIIEQNTEVAITSFEINYDLRQPPRGVLELIQGKIKAFIKGWGQPSRYSIRAGVAVCSLRGEESELEFDPASGRLLVRVTRGEVVVTSPYGSKIIREGNSAMFIDGRFSGGPS